MSFLNDCLLAARKTRAIAITLLGLMVGTVAALEAATIQGRVYDALSDTYLNGAVVRIPNTDYQTITEQGGKFTLRVPPGNYTVEARYFGYPSETQVVQVSENGATVEFDMSATPEELETFVVEGRVVGQARALNFQRSSNVNASVVSADAIGQFPDQNAAEALNRLPGVSIERDQGEGRFVVIRGINPDLNSVAIDGVKLAAPGADERATLLDTIPSDTIQQLEVYKSVLPSMPGDSVGGYINIKTPSAYDFDNTVVRFTGQGNYSELVDEWEGKFSGTYGDVFNEGTVGFIINASYEERTFGSDNNEADPWEIEDGIDGSSGYTSGEIQFREYDLTRIRTGISANLEFRPSEDNTYFIRGSYNNYQDTEIRHRINLEPDEFDAITATAFTGVGSEVVREFKDREENLGVQALSAGGENIIGNWTIDYKLSYSFAEEDTPYDFETIYELSDVVDIRFTGTDSYLLGISQQGGLDYTDPANYEFDEVVNAFQIVEEDDVSAEANFTYNFNEGPMDSVQFGFLARQKSKTSDAEEFVSDDNPAAIEDFGQFSFFGGRDPLQTMLPYTAPDYRSFFVQNESAFAMERDLAASAVEDFDADEDVLALYAQATAMVSEWQIIFGARFEDTQYSTTGFDYNDDTEVVSQTQFDKDYSNFLPGIHFRREFGDDVVFRFSANQTISRPNFEQTLPGAEIEGDEVAVGNPLLDPLEASNLDISMEYYFPPLGVFSASLFYKDIEDFIYEQVLIQDFGSIADAEVTTFRNGPSGDIQGLELGYQQQFTGALDGFGIIANLTLTDGEAEVLGPEEGDPNRTLPFIKQSDTVGSLALTYENYGFFFRIAATYRDDYLDEVGENELEDRYIDEFIQWDVSTSYDFNENWSIFADFTNIDDEPFRAYFAESGRLSQWESYSWTASAGFRWVY